MSYGQAKVTGTRDPTPWDYCELGLKCTEATGLRPTRSAHYPAHRRASRPHATLCMNTKALSWQLLASS